MRKIDELHLEHPFAGARMLRDMLKFEGVEIGRKHVGTLMKKMGKCIPSGQGRNVRSPFRVNARSVFAKTVLVLPGSR